jgi:hypothetical protein
MLTDRGFADLSTVKVANGECYTPSNSFAADHSLSVTALKSRDSLRLVVFSASFEI